MKLLMTLSYKAFNPDQFTHSPLHYITYCIAAHLYAVLHFELKMIHCLSQCHWCIIELFYLTGGFIKNA